MADDFENRPWIEDRDWRLPVVPGVVECSFPRCDGRAVAILRRRRHRNRRSFTTADFYYCPEHLYGRRIEDGKVLTQVHPDSPAAQRGWTCLDAPVEAWR